MGNEIYEKIDPRLYLIHVMFISIMIIFSTIKYKVPKIKNNKNKIFVDNEYLIRILNIIWIVSFLGLIIILRDDIFRDKTKMPGGLYGYYIVIYHFILVYSVVANYKFKKYKSLLIQFPSLMLTVIQGHRSYLVFILLAIITNEFINNKFRIYKIKHMIFIIVTGLFGFVGKSLIVAIRMGLSVKEIIINVFSGENIMRSITNSEPFLIQHILNKTIISEFKLGIEYMARLVLKIFFISPNKIIKVESFYDAFTSRFYPNLNYGIAYNIFSEPYAIAGILGVFIFIILYGFTLNYIDNLVRSENEIVSSMALALSSIYTFYIFRNSIENIILWTQVLGIILTICYIFQLMKYKLKIYYIKEND